MRPTPIALAVTFGLLAQQAHAAGFIEDSKATLNLRNFYYDSNVRNADKPSTQEWGQGAVVNLTSGYTQGTVGFGVDAIGLVGIRLDGGGNGGADDSRKPGALFPLESNGKAASHYGKAGITAKVRYAKTEARLGTLQPKLPVVSFNDGRLLPQLFEGAQITSNDIDNLTLIAGKLEQTKTRSSTDSVDLRIARPKEFDIFNAESDAFYYAGADYKGFKDLTLQYYFGNLEDFYKQHFVGLIHSTKWGEGTLKTDLRYFDSSSDGKNSRAAGRAQGYVSNGYWPLGDADQNEVDNQTWSALFTYSLNGHSLGLGYQEVGGNSAFPFLNQGDGSTAYLITDRQIGKFLSAGEKTTLIEYSYDFASVGVPGLKVSSAYLKGTNVDRAGSDGKEWERDFRVDYTVQSGTFKGVGLTWRNASIRGNVTDDADENRLIVSYSLPLF